MVLPYCFQRKTGLLLNARGIAIPEMGNGGIEDHEQRVRNGSDAAYNAIIYEY